MWPILKDKSDDEMVAVTLGRHQAPPENVIQSLATLANETPTTLWKKLPSIWGENNIQQSFPNVQRWKNRKFS